MTQPKSYWLKFTLLSDTTFGRGDGVAGLVDAEVQHDRYGLPYLGGKTLKGLLGAACAEVLSALEKSEASDLSDWQTAAAFLFGVPGSGPEHAGKLKVGDAKLPPDLRLKIAAAFPPNDEPEKQQQMRLDNLNSLTTLRRQTAMDSETGAPKEHTLRTMRVILKGTPFIAQLDFLEAGNEKAHALLAATVKAFSRAGTGRNRGTGRLTADLFDKPFYRAEPPQALTPDPITADLFAKFKKEVQA